MYFDFFVDFLYDQKKYGSNYVRRVVDDACQITSQFRQSSNKVDMV